MTITTLLLTLLSIPTLMGGELQDLCDIVNPDTGVPVRCEAHPDGAPVLDAAVCCDDNACHKPWLGSCADSQEMYYCELGEVLASDEIACYFEVPDYCEVFPCDPGYQTHPQSNEMCCHEGVCWPYKSGSGDCEIGDLYWCFDGVTNEDGTVTCFD